MGRDGYSEADLALLATAVERVLMAEGLPAGAMTDFGTKKAHCDVHAQSVSALLHMLGGLRVRVVHCGCDRFCAPVASPPKGVDEIAGDLAEDVLWYWHRRDEARAMLETVRTSVEAEFERDRALGHDTALLGVSLDDFETYHGRLQMYVRVDMRLMRHGLLPISWAPAFRSSDQVRKWFRSNRPAWRKMAQLRDERAKVGAVGAIDTVALNALRHAGWDPADAVRLLVRRDHGVPFDLHGVELVLGWRMQTLEGRFDIAPGVRWDFGRLIFANADDVPKRVGPGVIDDYHESPLLPEGAPVTCRSGNLTVSTIHINPPLTLFGISDGKVTWIE